MNRKESDQVESCFTACQLSPTAGLTVNLSNEWTQFDQQKGKADNSTDNKCNTMKILTNKNYLTSSTLREN